MHSNLQPITIYNSTLRIKAGSIYRNSLMDRNFYKEQKNFTHKRLPRMRPQTNGDKLR